MRTIKISLSVAAAVAVLVFFLFSSDSQRTFPSTELSGAGAATSSVKIERTKKARASAVSPKASPQKSTAVSTTTSEVQTAATLVIDGKSYAIRITVGENVFDMMRSLETAGDITFTSREYVGMGHMILSINGKASNGEMTWIFYINGKQAQKGVSSIIVSPEDMIEWKYEKSY